MPNSITFQPRSPAISAHDSECFEIDARSPVVNSARSENSRLLNARLSTTTSGNCRGLGICDFRCDTGEGTDLGSGANENAGDAGGDVVDCRGVRRNGVWNLGRGELGDLLLFTSLDMDCDLEWARRRGGIVCDDEGLSKEMFGWWWGLTRVVKSSINSSSIETSVYAVFGGNFPLACEAT